TGPPGLASSEAHRLEGERDLREAIVRRLLAGEMPDEVVPHSADRVRVEEEDRVVAVRDDQQVVVLVRGDQLVDDAHRLVRRDVGGSIPAGWAGLYPGCGPPRAGG